MKIFVKAKTGAKKEEVVEIDSSHYAVSVKDRPIGGKANIAIIKALAAHFGLSASQVSVLSGHTSKQKIVEIS